jgi:hypothetical protein
MMKDNDPARQLIENLTKTFKEHSDQVPPPAFELVKEGDQTFFVHRLPHTPVGEFEIRFRPGEGLAKKAQAHAEFLIKQVLDNGVIGNGKTERRIRDVDIASNCEGEWPPIVANWFLVFFLHCLANNLTLAIKATEGDAALVTAAKLQSVQIQAAATAVDAVNDIKVSGLDDFLNANIEEATKEKRSLLTNYLKAVAPLRLDQIGHHYERLHPIWKEIRTTPEAYREILIEKYKKEGITIEDDLLARLLGKVPSLSKGMQMLIAEKGDEANPSNIALEHAARMCGAWPYQFDVRTLFRARKAAGGQNGA